MANEEKKPIVVDVPIYPSQFTEFPNPRSTVYPSEKPLYPGHYPPKPVYPGQVYVQPKPDK